MTVEELLAQFETRPDVERVRAMVALGRRDDEEASALIPALEARGFYERRLALFSCYGSRNRAHVLRALNDPSAILRDLAARLVPVVCDDTQAHEALQLAPAQLRRPLLRRLLQRRRQAPIDAYVGTLAPNDPQLPRLLPLASPEIIRAHADDFLRLARDVDWERLGSLRPAIALDLLERWVGDGEAGEGRPLRVLNALLPDRARVDPDRALDLVRRLTRSIPLMRVQHLETLARARPAAVVQLLVADGEYQSYRLYPLLRYFTPEQFIALRAVYGQSLGYYVSSWFPHLTPEQRVAVFSALQRDLRGWQGGIEETVVAALPRTLREREARRQLKRQQLGVNARIRYAAYLPWAEALTVLQPHLAASDVATRQTALQALIGAVAYNRAHLADALTLLLARRMEQDSVRSAMFAALLKLPPGIWRAEHLADLTEIIRAGLNDIGLSQYTLKSLQSLLLRLAPRHPAWAAAQLATTLRERGWADPEVPADLPRSAAVAQVIAALLPVLDGWIARENETAALDALAAFAIDGVAPTLTQPHAEELLRRTRSRPNAERALVLLESQRDQLILALLEEDRSWITLSPVSRYLFAQRQDLLTPYLDSRRYAGRWETGRTPFLPPLERRFTRGTAAQQDRYAAALLATIADPEQEASALTAAVNRLAFLPAISVDRIATLTTDSRSVVRTSAFFSLARLDTEAGLPTLVAALRDDRARTAVRALSPFLKRMPPNEALAILRDVPLERVTVAKEVVRFIGDLWTEEAYQELLAREQSDLQRDVRIALLGALSAYLDHEPTWEVYARAATSADSETAQALLTLSPISPHNVTTLPANQRGRYFGLLARLVAHPDRETRQEALRDCARLSIADSEKVLLPTLLQMARAANPREAAEALEAALAICDERDAQAMADLLRELAPRRRLLKRAVKALEPDDTRARQRLLPVARAMIGALEDDPLTITPRVRLAGWYLDADELAAYFEGMSARGEWHDEALMVACATITNQDDRLSAEQWRALEGRLGASADERLRRLAFAALKAWAARVGDWEGAPLERLRVYRADPAPLVAAAAQFTLPAVNRDS
jgi:HEAT repeat protein